MKLLVFAHIPPPHHGQSYMVKLMLDGLGGDCRRTPHSGPVQCYHVDARVSDTMEDIGSFRIGKLFLLLRYCMEAIWCRVRHGVRAFYYVPAPGKRAALFRDWVVMLVCRPFFRDFVHHWHASGLGDWLRKEGTWIERWITNWLIGNPALSLSLAVPSMRDALWFCSKRVEVLANGIPDPCPDYDISLRPVRDARRAARASALRGENTEEGSEFRVLYLAHCTREKGVFETMKGVAHANETLRSRGLTLRVKLKVAGAFLHPEEEPEMHTALAEANAAEPCVEYLGFIGGEQKARLLQENDCMCFPTYYSAEGQPVSLLEAMAFGLQIVTTRWRAIPDLMPDGHSGFCAPRDPADVAEKLIAICTEDSRALRDRFVSGYTADSHVAALRGALERLGTPAPLPA